MNDVKEFVELIVRGESDLAKSPGAGIVGPKSEADPAAGTNCPFAPPPPIVTAIVCGVEIGIEFFFIVPAPPPPP